MKKDKNEINKQIIEDVIALTPMQEGMLYHYLKDPESEQYFEQLNLEISGEIDWEIFEKAWNVVIRTNEMLRVVFRWQKLARPIQIILKEYTLKPEFYDFSDQEARGRQKSIEEIKAKDKKEKFDLWEVPFRVTLCKCGKDQNEMIISNHHILYDRWSNGIIIKEFLKAYEELCKVNIFIPPVKSKFKEFVQWIQTCNIEKQKRYWQHYLQGFDTQTVLSIRGKEKNACDGDRDAYQRYRVVWSGEMKSALGVAARERQLTAASIFYSAWGLLLQRYNNSDDVLFGTTVSGRNVKINGIEEMVGLFINTVPLRMQYRSHESIENFLYRIDEQLKERQEFEHIPLVKIKEYSEIESQGEIFNTIVVMENYPLTARLKSVSRQLSITSHSIVEMTHYDLTVGLSLFDEIALTFTYRKDKFDEVAVRRLSNHFQEIVYVVLTLPGKEISCIEMITEEEKRLVLYDFNDTKMEYPWKKTIHQLFAEQAESTPGHIALVSKEEGRVLNASGAEHLSYKELNERSHQLTCLLTKKGVKTGTIVGVLMEERSIEMIVGFLGILKAGGAYLPIDPGYPGIGLILC